MNIFFKFVNFLQIWMNICFKINEHVCQIQELFANFDFFCDFAKKIMIFSKNWNFSLKIWDSFPKS